VRHAWYALRLMSKKEQGNGAPKAQPRPLSLVTGACGFMGTHMVEVLAEAGHRVRATDLPGAWASDDRKVGRFPSVVRAAGAEIVPADITKPETLVDLAKDVDYVFHIAAVFNYSAPMSVLERVNVGGTKNLTDEVLRHGKVKRLVLWGAGGVYGVPEPGRPIVEDMPAKPMNNYLRSKDQQEKLVMELGTSKGLPWTIIRPTGVYGPRAVYGGGQMIMGPAGMKVVAIPANFTARIPFVHVRDVVRAALHLATEPQAKGQIYNLNDDTQMSTVDYMRHVSALMGSFFVKLPPVPIKPLKRVLVAAAKASQTAARRLGTTSPIEADTIAYLGEDFTYSNDKLKGAGFKFLYPDARDGVRDTIEWYRKEGWLQS
jgi:nucleoside-diphosphate-sugar epimerase